MTPNHEIHPAHPSYQAKPKEKHPRLQMLGTVRRLTAQIADLERRLAKLRADNYHLREAARIAAVRAA